jgi:hypothetical protein
MFMLPQITLNRHYDGVDFYANLSTLSRGNLTINVQSITITVHILYHKYKSQNTAEY